MDESQNHYVEQKKPDRKGWLMYDYIYVKLTKRAICGYLLRGTELLIGKGHKGTFSDDGDILYFDPGPHHMDTCVHICKV